MAFRIDCTPSCEESESAIVHRRPRAALGGSGLTRGRGSEKRGMEVWCQVGLPHTHTHTHKTKGLEGQFLCCDTT